MSHKETSNLVLGFLLFGNKREKQYIHLFSQEVEAKIRMALTALLKNEGTPRYINLEEPTTGSVLQFAGSVNEKLFFNLPAKRFDERQIQRAKSVLNPYQIRFEEEPLYLDEAGNQVGDSLRTFSKNIGDNIDLALEICSKVFFDIYRLEDGFELEVSGL